MTDDATALFESVTPGIQETIAELKSKGELVAGFRREYEKLFRALEKSHGSEQRMVNKTKALIQEIAKHQEAIQRAKKEEEDLQQTKKRLEEETAKAFQDVAATHKIVLEKRQRMNALNSNMESLESNLSKGSGWTDEQMEQRQRLEETRDQLARKAEAKRMSLMAARTESQQLADELKDAEREKVAIEQSIMNVKKDIADKKAESARALKRKDQLDLELRNLKARIERMRVEVEEKQGAIQDADGQIQGVENALKASRKQMDKFLREYDNLHQRTIALTDDLDNQMHSNQLLANDLNEREAEILRKRNEAEQVLKEDRRLEKLHTLSISKTEKVDEDKEDLDRRKAEIRDSLAAVMVELESDRKKAEELKKKNADLMREREILNKSLVRGADRTRETEDLSKIHRNTRKNLENENSAYKTHALRQRQTIESLQEERQRYSGEAEAANQKYYTALEQVKLQELQVSQLQRKIAEGEAKLKQQQNLYEAVRSDRNLYSKNLIEAQEEIEEMRRKFKIMNHQIDQLKEEITAKDHALVKEHFDHHKVEKEKDNLKNELTRVQKQIQSSEHIINNQTTEMQKLAHIIQEADEERQRQQKEYDAVVSERDILGGQLIRRDDELASLYEKIKIQKSTLAKGQSQFNEKQAVLAQLKQHIRALQQELAVSKQQVANIGDLKGEVFRLERELLRERTKIKRLSEELERPLNVHRWRKLEGSDPQRFEMIRRIQQLQKRLIQTTEETVERDLLIQEKERLFVELKNILARQPGPEVSEQLAVYAQNLKQKQKQMKAMDAELEMYKAQVNEYKHDIERLNREMHDLTQQFFKNMRRKHRANAAAAAASDAMAGLELPSSPAAQAQALSAIDQYMHGDLTGITAGHTFNASGAGGDATH